MSRNRSWLAKGSKIVVAAVALISILCWRAKELGFKTASMNDVRAVLPAELLKQEPVNEEAQRRYLDLVAMIPQVDGWEVEALLCHQVRDTNRQWLSGVNMQELKKSCPDF